MRNKRLVEFMKSLAEGTKSDLATVKTEIDFFTAGYGSMMKELAENVKENLDDIIAFGFLHNSATVNLLCKNFV